jgi:tetratricopeptide (TPR) repeat protein
MSTENDLDHVVFGKLVRERRRVRGWSQEALAAEAFSNLVRKNYVSLIENGKIPGITSENVKKIAKALNIDAEHIPPSLLWQEAAEEIVDTNKKVLDLIPKVDAANAMLTELIARSEDRAREFGMKEGLLIGVARKYAEGNPDNFDAALKGIESALETAHDMAERGRLPSNLSAAVDAVVARVTALNNESKLDEAQKVILDELAALDEEDARRRAERVRLYDTGIDQARLTNSPVQASRFVIARFDLDAPEGDDDRFEALRSIQVEWYVRGRDKSVNFDLEVSINLSKIIVARATTADACGTALNDLGNALVTLGERENRTDRLEEAIGAYLDALKERTRDRVPLQWAMTQTNLGNTLRRLGERETGTERLEAAVAAYLDALKERTRERVPLEWAKTQMHLGIALQTLGQRESGTRWLDMAFVAYLNALEELTREREPVYWAGTQMNIGNVLTTLGERENGTGRLEAAAAAYQNALKEWTRESVPLNWAMAQMNLGNVFLRLGQRESSTERLYAAVAAYQEALQERTRERMPLDWAMTQMNLGSALQTLGQRESSSERLQEAVVAYQEALQERTRERVPLDWAATIGNRAVAQRIIAELTSDIALARQALDGLMLAAQISRDGGQMHNAEQFEAEAQKTKMLVAHLNGS